MLKVNKQNCSAVVTVQELNPLHWGNLTELICRGLLLYMYNPNSEVWSLSHVDSYLANDYIKDTQKQVTRIIAFSNVLKPACPMQPGKHFCGSSRRQKMLIGKARKMNCDPKTPPKEHVKSVTGE